MKSAQTPHYLWQHPDWTRLYYDMSALAEPLANAHLSLGVVIGKAQAIGLTQTNLDDVSNSIWIEEAIATAAIEGQKLDAEQVRSSVMRKLGLADHGTSSRHIDGLIEVMFDATQQVHLDLTADKLCRWQSALFPGGTSGIQRIEVGKFRTFSEPMQIISGRIGKEIVHYCAPDSNKVAQEMATFLAWFNAPAEQTQQNDSIIRAAIAHLWFETIHPFEDGNGRIGRAIIDLALAQDRQLRVSGMARLASMSRTLQENRRAYYDALNHAQTGGRDITSWISWFLVQFSNACKKTEQHIGNALQKAQFWSSHRDSDFNLRQRKTLQKLLDAGDNGFLGGMTAEKHSKITGASKATATRDLTELLAKGALISRGAGKATKYYIHVIGWNLG